MKNRLAQILAAAILAGMTASCGPSPPSTAVVAAPSEIQEAIHRSEASLTLVHVWATWCDPCREEFPELLKAYRYAREKGLALLLVSADDPADLETVNAFLRQHHSPVDSLVSTELNEEFIELFSTNWAGALPASFFFDANGALVGEWSGKRSYNEYIQAIDQLLKP
jgi:thiol-disulfide isomerase/thioredoxin